MPVMKALDRADLAAQRNTLEACDQWWLAPPARLVLHEDPLLLWTHRGGGSWVWWAPLPSSSSIVLHALFLT